MLNDPIGNIDASGLVPGPHTGPKGPFGPPDMGADVKAILCKYIKQCQGDFNCVYTAINKARNNKPYKGGPSDPNTWNDPNLRMAENFAVAAATNSGMDYGPLDGALVHNGLGITGYQTLGKAVEWGLGIPHSPATVGAWNAGMAGLYWHNRNDPAAAIKWCDDCQK